MSEGSTNPFHLFQKFLLKRSVQKSRGKSPRRCRHDGGCSAFQECHLAFLACHMTFLECHMTFLGCHMTFLECHMTSLECHMTFLECHMGSYKPIWTPRGIRYGPHLIPRAPSIGCARPSLPAIDPIQERQGARRAPGKTTFHQLGPDREASGAPGGSLERGDVPSFQRAP